MFLVLSVEMATCINFLSTQTFEECISTHSQQQREYTPQVPLNWPLLLNIFPTIVSFAPVYKIHLTKCPSQLRAGHLGVCIERWSFSPSYTWLLLLRSAGSDQVECEHNTVSRCSGCAGLVFVMPLPETFSDMSQPLPVPAPGPVIRLPQDS